MADPPANPGVPEQPSGFRRERPQPVRSPVFDHLALDELRAYRNELADEETRVSYWRRVLQARLDTISSSGGRHSGGAGRRARQRNLRTDDLDGGRNALLQVVPAAGLPPLPGLEELWRLDTPEDDPLAESALTELLGRLEAAEEQLSAYRHSLHARIDAATAELIARYREQPALAIRALPLNPPTRPRTTGY